MEKYDSFQAWWKGVVPYAAKDLDDYLTNRDLVGHRRNGIIASIPIVTVETNPDKLDIGTPPPDAEVQQIIDLRFGRIYDRNSGAEEKVRFSLNFLGNFVLEYMMNFNEGENSNVRTAQNVVLQYHKDFEYSIIHSAGIGNQKKNRTLKDIIDDYSRDPGWWDTVTSR